MIWMKRISLIWLIAAALLIVSNWTQWVPHWQAAYYGWLVLFSSFVAFLLNGFDKLQARRDHRRVPEKWLHFWELIGGWPGAYFSQQLFRHKTFKPSYRKIFWLMVLSHMVLLAVALIFSLPRTEATPSAQSQQLPT